MYKCTECGMEYEVKPDYCDCGNDEFVITVEEKKEGNVIWEEEKGFGYPIDENSYENNKKIQQKEAIKEKTNASEPEIYRPKLELPKTDPISLTIFLICLVLSVIIAFLPVKTNENTNIIKTKETKITKNIPSIDKFWNNTMPAAAEKPVIPEPVAVKVVTPVRTAAKPAAKPAGKPVQTKKTAPKQTTVKLQKNPAVSTAEQAKKAEEAKKKAEEAKKAEAARKAAEQAKKYEEVKKHAEDMQQTMYNKQELANYKANLRNTIGKKIDFTKVIGDGDCIISFAVDKSGRLVNGAFAKQSTNMTLNDAVYKAFMSSRNFTAPPSGYKDETLKLYVRFYNGNFEISLN